MKRPVFRDLVPKIVLLVASALLSLSLAEAVFWVFPGLLPEGTQAKLHWAGQTGRIYGSRSADPHFGYLPTPPGSIHPDSATSEARPPPAEELWGDRNIEPWPDQADIVVVGNSMAYSQEVDREEAWTNLLDRALPRSRVVTLGLIGGAPQQYLRIYESFGTPLRPKVLLFCLFPGNDPADALAFDAWLRSDRELDYPTLRGSGYRSASKGWAHRILRKSRLFALVDELRMSYRDGNLFGGKTLHLASGERVQLVSRFLRGAAWRARPSREEFQMVMEILEETRRSAEARGTKCVVLLFPTKEEIYLPGLEENVPSLTGPFASKLAERGFSFLDLSPVFRERATDGRALYFEVDGHPNRLGYALVAEAVLAYLVDHAPEFDPLLPAGALVP